MNSMFVFSCVLCIAISSPLLTYTAAWQIKEWRLDRMAVHIREEGIFTTLVGKLRGILLAVYLVLFLLPQLSEMQSIWLAISALAVLSLVQFSTRKQRLPTFTKKAQLITSLAGVLSLAGITLLYAQELLFTPLSLLLLYVQPLIIGVAIGMVKPIDTHAKNALVHKAMNLRSALSTTPVIGITGSVGKTTCKELLKHITADTNALVTPEHVNTEIGVANWFISAIKSNPTPNCIIVEMGAYRVNEIERLTRMMQPTIGIITAIGNQHIGLFGSQENIYKAKSELFVGLPTNGTAIYSKDSVTTSTLAETTKAQCITVGTQVDNLHTITNSTSTNVGCTFTLHETEFFTPIIGQHNVLNIAFAIEAALAIGISKEVIQQKLATFGGIQNTFTVYTKNNCTIVDDTHNSSEASVLAAIAWAKEQEHPQKILCLSGVIELGSQFNEVHKRLGLEARRVFDRIICTNKRAALALEAGFGKPVEIFSTHTVAVAPGSLLVCEGRIPTNAIAQLSE